VIRAVLDTNIWLGAILWHGAAFQTRRRAETGDYTSVTSNAILHELVKVLRFDFGFPDEFIFEWWIYLNRLCEVIRVISQLNLVERDPDDNKFIECAVDGQCEYIVSRDRHLLDLKSYEDIRIITVGNFLQVLDNVPTKEKENS
jgi:putative PIN family toxin of toxin-antitoxin system